VEIDSNKIYSKEISIFGDFINPYTMRKAINMINSGLIDYPGMEDHIMKINDVGDLFKSGKKNFIKPLISYK
jgi:threonine dehydrogenase-like Zn-dependent dehydrogenase